MRKAWKPFRNTGVLAALALGAGAGCSRMQSTPPAAAAPAAVRYLALGDSFTAGTGSAPSQAFPARLAERWGACVELRNVAVNGFTTDDLIAEELPELDRFHPTVVTVAIGANDIVRGREPAEYRGRLRTIFAAIGRAQVGRVFALPQPDWSQSPAARAFGAPEAIAARIAEANGVLRDEAESARAVYVDLYPMMRDQARAGMIAGDGLHPSAAAYDAWATELAKRAPGCER